jgi:NADPH:quinone reductase-like Zn-dependent oxidoreductase
VARWRGATVLSTTRQAGSLALLKEHGVDHPLLDTGEVAPPVRALYPDGVDAALTSSTLPDTLRTVRVHGPACFGYATRIACRPSEARRSQASSRWIYRL